MSSNRAAVLVTSCSNDLDRFGVLEPCYAVERKIM